MYVMEQNAKTVVHVKVKRILAMFVYVLMATQERTVVQVSTIRSYLSSFTIIESYHAFINQVCLLPLFFSLKSSWMIKILMICYPPHVNSHETDKT